MSARKDVCLGGVCPEGVSAQGGVCLGGVPLWTEFLTHACENMTFQQLLLRTVNIYRPQTKFAKVMFLQVSVTLSTGGACVVARGACVVAPGWGGHAWFYLGGHAWFYLGGPAWFYLGGMRGFIWGGVHGFIQGGMHGFIQGGHAWFYSGGHAWFFQFFRIQ